MESRLWKEIGMTWTHRRPRRLVGALLLAGLLASAVSAPAAQPTATRPERPEARQVVRSETLLARFGRLLTSFWGAEGGFIDPFGHPQSSSSTQQPPSQPLSDNGPFIDPFGGH